MRNNNFEKENKRETSGNGKLMKTDEIEKQAGAELGKAQPKLVLN